VDCYGREASNRNKELVEGQTVYLEKDVSETDAFGRLLRYVHVGGIMVNELLVSEGFAVSSTYPPDVKYQERFLAAQTSARNAGRGLWAGCLTAPPPLLQPFGLPVAPAAATPAGSSANCHPSYPTVCIPPPPPDLDCPEISFRRFTVVGADPHRFDADRDGIGCET
jgi:micrococcal nuclease